MAVPRRPYAAAADLALILAGACSRPAERPAHAAAPAQSPPPATTPAVTPPPPAPGGADFSKEVRLLYRVVACGGDEPVAPLDAAVVDDYCKWLIPRLAEWERDYLSKARPFLAARRPASLPSAVVYPFGGGDLLSALTTYPDAPATKDALLLLSAGYTALGQTQLAADTNRVLERTHPTAVAPDAKKSWWKLW